MLASELASRRLLLSDVMLSKYPEHKNCKNFVSMVKHIIGMSEK